MNLLNAKVKFFNTYINILYEINNETIICTYDNLYITVKTSIKNDSIDKLNNNIYYKDLQVTNTITNEIIYKDIIFWDFGEENISMQFIFTNIENFIKDIQNTIFQNVNKLKGINNIDLYCTNCNKYKTYNILSKFKA
jgi:hypothetical protein